MKSRVLLFIGLAAAVGAAAPDGGDGARSRLIVAHNQLGLLHYCKAQGLVEDTAVSDAAKALAKLPAQPGVGDAEEAEGARGVVAFGGSRVPLEQDAAAAGITLRWRCAESAAMAAAWAGR